MISVRAQLAGSLLQSDPMARERYYVPALDGLRFFAFLLVFFHHAAPNTLPDPKTPPDWQYWWHALVMGGAFGVPIFFALSGYLLTTLLQKEREATGKIDIRAFYLRRILRIWPLYFLVVLVDGVLYPLLNHQPIEPMHLLGLATFTANFQLLPAQSTLSMPLMILWSVCIEEQFYLVWPWLNARLSPLSLRVSAWLMALAAIGFRAGAAGAGWWWSGTWFHTLGHLDAIGFGALAALELGSIKLKPLERSLIVAGMFAAVIVIGGMAPLSGINTPTPLLPALLYTVVAAVAALGVWALATSPKRYDGIFAWPTFVWLGRISYGLYALHTLVLAVLSLKNGLGFPAAMAIQLAVSVLVATGVFVCFESPFLRLKARYQAVPSGFGKQEEVASLQVLS